MVRAYRAWVAFQDRVLARLAALLLLGCTLLAQPDFLLLQPTASGATFVLPLPAAAVPPLTFFAQGGALYFTTIGLSTDLAFTDGAQVTVQ